jgi:glucose-fructose oxidoreductase
MVADLDLSRAKHLAAVAPFEHAVARAEELCGNVDLAIVALPNALHAPVSTLLLESGVHVLCEKPMARNVAECRQMIASAEKGRAILCVGHNRRYRSNLLEAQRLIGAGLLGNLERIEAEEGSTADWPRSKAYFDPAIAGGGSLLDVGIHSVDIIRFLAGEFLEVAYTGDQTADSVEGHCELRFKLVSGVEGVLLASRKKELGQRIVFRGSEGHLEAGLWSPELWLSRKKGKAFRHFDRISLNPVRRSMDASFVDQLLRFVKSIKSGGDSPISGDEGLKAVEIVQWAYSGSRPVRMNAS